MDLLVILLKEVVLCWDDKTSLMAMKGERGKQWEREYTPLKEPH